MKAKISIIVPVYNVQKYVTKCLDSLLSQTFKEIEVICINDASIDASLEILQNYRDKDDRVKILDLEQNGGTLNARIQGVSQASGEYIMFVDSDDYLSDNACESLYELLLNQCLDVIHFGTELHVGHNVSGDMAAWVERFLTPYEGKIENQNLVEACFLDEKFDFNITNKIWNAELCRKAFREINNISLVASEDRYIFFVLMYYTKSYMGISEKFYHYNLGIGITGGDIITLENFEKRCSGAKASEMVRQFISQKSDRIKYEKTIKHFEDLILWDCVDCWHNKLGENDSKVGFNILRKYFLPEQIASAISRVYFEDLDDIWNKAKIESEKCVGIYYRYLGYDNMDSVIRQYINKMQEQGCQVIVYTDMDRKRVFSESNFEVEVHMLPNSSEANWNKYEDRAYMFANLIREDNVDIFLYASPSSHICELDELLITMLGIPVIELENEIYLDEFGKEKATLVDEFGKERAMLLQELEKMQNNETSLKYMFKGALKLLIKRLKFD